MNDYNFCQLCGKYVGGSDGIHTCSPQSRVLAHQRISELEAQRDELLHKEQAANETIVLLSEGLKQAILFMNGERTPVDKLIKAREFLGMPKWDKENDTDYAQIIMDMLPQFGMASHCINQQTQISDVVFDGNDLIELAMLLEEEFEIEISDDEISECKTVNDVISLVAKLKGEQ